MSAELEVLRTSTTLLPQSARNTRFVGTFRDLYANLLEQALREFPPIEGYETTHVMLVERLVFFYVSQKTEEGLPAIADMRHYKTNISAFLRTCESLLKEARSISAEVAFKHNFVRQVVEVIDRSIPTSDHKTMVIKELAKLVT